MSISLPDLDCLGCLVEGFLINISHHIHIHVGEHGLKSVQETSHILQLIILVDGIVNEHLANAVAEPVDIEAVVLEQMQVKGPLEMAAMAESVDGGVVGLEGSAEDGEGDDGVVPPAEILAEGLSGGSWPGLTRIVHMIPINDPYIG